MERGMTTGWAVAFIVALAALVGLLYVLLKDTEPEPTPSTDGTPAQALSVPYTSSTYGFSLRYPDGFSVNDAYVYEGLGPGKEISGVSFTLPTSFVTGTNLSSDTKISVERLAAATSTCDTALFLGGAAASSTVVTEGGVRYRVATSSEAAAGNRYDETVYVLEGSPCTAVRYFVHSTALGNYPEGEVRTFDHEALEAIFDSIRRSLTLSR